MPRVLNPFSNVPSRREFIRLLALTGAAGASGSSLVGSRAAAAGPTFEEIPSSSSGITWIHDNAMSADRHLPETMGPGVAFLDYDNDGWLDIFMVNSGASDFYKPKAPLKNALYKNNRDGTFTDVTDKAGVAGGLEFGMGCAIADYDNDGHQDILVTAYGRCTLYHNNGNGTFTDVTEKSGVATPGWTTSAVWFDYDNDGRLDLMLCSFVQFSLANNVFCGDNKLGKRFYCIPRVFKPTPSFLYHNNGDGTFTEVSAGTDIQRALGKALGVVATDVNGDGLMDLFVANDTVQNFPVHESRQGQVGRDGPRRRSRFQRQRPAAIRDGRRCRRRQRRRQAGSLRRQRRSGDVLALPERGQRVVLAMSRHFTASRRRRAC